MTNDVQILNSYRNLRQIKRCNNLVTLVSEDVAQHSYYVALLAHKLAYAYNTVAAEHNNKYHPLDNVNNWETVQVKDCLTQALFHDLEEVFISDIPWDVKHHNDQVHSEIQNVLKQKLQAAYDKCNHITTDRDNILLAKTGLAGAIVDLADLLEGAWYCCEEIQLGNKTLAPLLSKYLELIHQSYIHAVLEGGVDMEVSSDWYIEFIRYLDSVGYSNGYMRLVKWGDSTGIV